MNTCPECSFCTQSYANNSNNCNKHVTISPASDETDLTDCFGEDDASLPISDNKLQALSVVTKRLKMSCLKPQMGWKVKFSLTEQSRASSQDPLLCHPGTEASGVDHPLSVHGFQGCPHLCHVHQQKGKGAWRSVALRVAICLWSHIPLEQSGLHVAAREAGTSISF